MTESDDMLKGQMMSYDDLKLKKRERGYVRRLRLLLLLILGLFVTGVFVDWRLLLMLLPALLLFGWMMVLVKAARAELTRRLTSVPMIVLDYQHVLDMQTALEAIESYPLAEELGVMISEAIEANRLLR